MVVTAVARFLNPDTADAEMRLVRVRALRRLGDDDVLSLLPRSSMTTWVSWFGSSTRCASFRPATRCGEIFTRVLVKCSIHASGDIYRANGDPQNDGEQNENRQNDRDDF